MAEGKQLVEAGKKAEGLELYRRAADELPGAPWLQQRTAELAKRLREPMVAVQYYRRAAMAFQIAAFPKRGIVPLRTAWLLAHEALPGSSQAFVDVTLDFAALQQRVGLASDATALFARSNAALRSYGFTEIPETRLSRSPLASVPPAASGARADGSPNC